MLILLIRRLSRRCRRRRSTARGDATRQAARHGLEIEERGWLGDCVLRARRRKLLLQCVEGLGIREAKV